MTVEHRIELIRKILKIFEKVIERGPQWKPGFAERHLLKRIDRGHLPQDFTLDAYQDLITRLMTKGDHETYLYYKNTFEQDYFVFGDRYWIVIVGEDGIVETAFPPDEYQVYLLAEKGYTYLGTIEELRNHHGY